ncbi:sigma-54-dependent Fis family transcriptional regulator [Desulfuromonas thiophila]|uniref:Transcriptional regulator of acetoin/glycerol metabolism n=1 Tax=Desulfuromonas thiophila TaxID=57664 RepID=A0A1G7DHZ9_9BACT|nr:sigma-54-dependent Fis family transcriptional regulator [Desulfuromonas thiophila]SDE51131.1 Transcriptional regulator of acetoin/glycerol metabolism [Desulfuromonas thiophila]
MTRLRRDRKEILEIKSRFLAGQPLPKGILPDPIRRSWQRCREKNLDIARHPNEISRVSQGAVDRFLERSKELFIYAEPVMSELQEQISATHSAVVLCDANGVVLHASGDPAFIDKTHHLNLQPGGIWTEEAIGTNAIGTALVERVPVSVHSSEHFLIANQQISCSAAPIFDAYEKIVGVLDVSSDCGVDHRHTLALVCMSAQIIENQIFASSCKGSILLHFHLRPEFIGTLYGGIVAISPSGKLLACNRFARAILGLESSSLIGQDIHALFTFSPAQFASHLNDLTAQAIRIQLHNGSTLFGRFQFAAESAWSTISSADKQQKVKSVSDASRETKHLDALNHGDPVLEMAIKKAKKIINYDIPLIIQGESGSGKEMFAKAFHEESLRRNKPFVALNCAAIPENLIESELFGYCDGAFTGARKTGYAGKIKQADGGTLFLDEIGDMPLNLQVRLLRVLQERSVTPLGGTKSLVVDLRIVCATNKRLFDEVKAGRFREDLYYRLNGLVIELPPLRKRQDKLRLAQKILEQDRKHVPVEFSNQVLNLFVQHNWPGNIRQMVNVIRTALALSDGNNQIRLEHLPDDFLQQSENKTELANSEKSATCCLKTQGDFLIHQTLRQENGNMSAAASKLGISRSTLYRKMKALGNVIN